MPGAFSLRGVRLALVVLFSLHCGDSQDARYTRESDAGFVSRFAGRWTATSSLGEVTLLLCEDPAITVCAAPTIGQDTGCTTTCHAIRGDGSSTPETLTVESAGCGCAGARAELGTDVSLSFASRAATLAGHLETSPTEADPYAGPIRLFSSADDDSPFDSSANGFFRDDGRLQLEARVSATNAAPGLAERLFFTKIGGSDACASSSP